MICYFLWDCTIITSCIPVLVSFLICFYFLCRGAVDISGSKFVKYPARLEEPSL